jgi:hypothetical protein
MDTAYITWGVLIGVGALFGLFLRPRTIGIIGLVLFGLAVLGIVGGYAVGEENVGFMSGVVAMAIPFLTGFLALGASIIRAVLKRDAT